MLTNEQVNALNRVQGNEALISAVLNEVVEILKEDFKNTEPHESKKREECYTKISLISDVDTYIKRVIQHYKNTH